MTKRERVELAYGMKKADRIPFVPAIYEHKGALVGKTPSEICRSAEALYDGLKAELAAYDPDMLVIGIDVYNVEAEAMGCPVVYFEDSSDCPGIVDPIISTEADMAKLHIPDPESEGRMPVYIDVARSLASELGAGMVLRGAVTGPYSMAAVLVGAEKFIMMTIEEPAFATKLIEYCAQATVAFSKAFLKVGVEPIIFDSRATPSLASPRVFRTMLKPVYRDYIIPELKAAGGRFLPLIIGGNTTPIVDDLIETGATQFLCDRPARLDVYRAKCLAAGRPFRANVDAVLVNTGPREAIRKQAVEILRDCHDHPGFLLGCGVVAFDGNRDYVMAIKEAIEEAAAGTLDYEAELGASARA